MMKVRAGVVCRGVRRRWRLLRRCLSVRAVMMFLWLLSEGLPVRIRIIMRRREAIV